MSALVTGCGDDKKEASTTSEAAPTSAAATGVASEPATADTAEAASTDEATTDEVGTDDVGTEGQVTEDVPLDLAAGKTIFVTQPCAACHTLADAGAKGTTGPNLDELKPDAATVAAQVASGGGGMPSFADQLTEADIRNVAGYVAEVAGKQ